jgi:hypothetical protein
MWSRVKERDVAEATDASSRCPATIAIYEIYDYINVNILELNKIVPTHPLMFNQAYKRRQYCLHIDCNVRKKGNLQLQNLFYYVFIANATFVVEYKGMS